MIIKRHQVEFKKKIRIMRMVLLAGTILTVFKFFAWYLTHSNAVLTDALESIINIIAAGFGLFTLVYASRPKDENHPYGHGKMEFFAVGFEGALICFAGIGMIYKAISSFSVPFELQKLDIGLAITAGAAVINYGMGRYMINSGKKLHSSTLVADGQHLVSDTVSSVVLLIGLGLILLTGYTIIDSILTIALGFYILFVGYRLLRNSMAGLMDETDFDKMLELVDVLNEGRKPNWIDIHNLRIVKYGSSLHVDLHLSLPWYDSLQKSHEEVKALEELVNKHFENRVEFFIHTDPCLPTSCQICSIDNCAVRKQAYEKKIEWDLPLLMKNKPHFLK